VLLRHLGVVFSKAPVQRGTAIARPTDLHAPVLARLEFFRVSLQLPRELPCARQFRLEPIALIRGFVPMLDREVRPKKVLRSPHNLGCQMCAQNHHFGVGLALIPKLRDFDKLCTKHVRSANRLNKVFFGIGGGVGSYGEESKGF